MPYNPGIQSIPFHADLSNWGKLALGMIQEGQEAEGLRTTLGGPKQKPLLPGQEALERPMDFGSLGNMEGPNEGTGEGGATEEMKAAAKVSKAMRDIGEHGYGIPREQLDTMGIGELRGLMRKEELKRINRELGLKIMQGQREQEQLDIMRPVHEQTVKRSQAEMKALMEDQAWQQQQRRALGEFNDQVAAWPAAQGIQQSVPDTQAGWAIMRPPNLQQDVPYGGDPTSIMQRPMTRQDVIDIGARTRTLAPKEVVGFMDHPESNLDRAHIAELNAQAAERLRKASAPRFTPGQIVKVPGLDSHVFGIQSDTGAGTFLSVPSESGVVSETDPETGEVILGTRDTRGNFKPLPRKDEFKIRRVPTLDKITGEPVPGQFTHHLEATTEEGYRKGQALLDKIQGAGQAQPGQEQFKAGDRVKQKGVTYKFDGTAWKPVK